jgi:hypothetical protein
VVRHTPATAVAAFITDQVPEPRSALVLACVLQLTDTDDGARGVRVAGSGCTSLVWVCHQRAT